MAATISAVLAWMGVPFALAAGRLYERKKLGGVDYMVKLPGDKYIVRHTLENVRNFYPDQIHWAPALGSAWTLWGVYMAFLTSIMPDEGLSPLLTLLSFWSLGSALLSLISIVLFASRYFQLIESLYSLLSSSFFKVLAVIALAGLVVGNYITSPPDATLGARLFTGFLSFLLVVPALISAFFSGHFFSLFAIQKAYQARTWDFIKAEKVKGLDRFKAIMQTLLAAATPFLALNSLASLFFSFQITEDTPPATIVAIFALRIGPFLFLLLKPSGFLEETINADLLSTLADMDPDTLGAKNEAGLRVIPDARHSVHVLSGLYSLFTNFFVYIGFIIVGGVLSLRLGDTISPLTGWFIADLINISAMEDTLQYVEAPVMFLTLARVLVDRTQEVELIDIADVGLKTGRDVFGWIFFAMSELYDSKTYNFVIADSKRILAVPEYKDDHRVKFFLADAYHRTGANAEAEVLLEQVLKNRPNYFDALSLISVVKTILGRDQKEIEAIVRRMLALRKTAHTWFSLGVVLGKDPERQDEAIAAYRKSLTYRKRPATYLNLGILLINHKNDREGAVALMEKAHEESPEDMPTVLSLSTELMALGRNAEADALLRTLYDIVAERFAPYPLDLSATNRRLVPTSVKQLWSFREPADLLSFCDASVIMRQADVNIYVWNYLAAIDAANWDYVAAMDANALPSLLRQLPDAAKFLEPVQTAAKAIRGDKSALKAVDKAMDSKSWEDTSFQTSLGRITKATLPYLAARAASAHGNRKDALKYLKVARKVHGDGPDFGLDLLEVEIYRAADKISDAHKILNKVFTDTEVLGYMEISPRLRSALEAWFADVIAEHKDKPAKAGEELAMIVSSITRKAPTRARHKGRVHAMVAGTAALLLTPVSKELAEDFYDEALKELGPELAKAHAAYAVKEHARKNFTRLTSRQRRAIAEAIMTRHPAFQVLDNFPIFLLNRHIFEEIPRALEKTETVLGKLLVGRTYAEAGDEYYRRSLKTPIPTVQIFLRLLAVVSLKKGGAVRQAEALVSFLIPLATSNKAMTAFLKDLQAALNADLGKQLQSKLSWRARNDVEPYERGVLLRPIMSVFDAVASPGKRPVSDDDGLVVVNPQREGFVTVRSNASVARGAWYYEFKIRSGDAGSSMQIGWASPSSDSLLYDGFGTGDDLRSWAVDGLRGIKLHKDGTQWKGVPPWNKEDVVGLGVDFRKGTMSAWLNGKALGVVFDNVKLAPGQAVVPSVSLGTFQSVVMDFGSEKPLESLPKGYRPLTELWKRWNYNALSRYDKNAEVDVSEDGVSIYCRPGGEELLGGARGRAPASNSKGRYSWSFKITAVSGVDRLRPISPGVIRIGFAQRDADFVRARGRYLLGDDNDGFALMVHADGEAEFRFKRRSEPTQSGFKVALEVGEEITCILERDNNLVRFRSSKTGSETKHKIREPRGLFPAIMLGERMGGDASFIRRGGEEDDSDSEDDGDSGKKTGGDGNEESASLLSPDKKGGKSSSKKGGKSSKKGGKSSKKGRRGSKNSRRGSKTSKNSSNKNKES